MTHDANTARKLYCELYCGWMNVMLNASVASVSGINRMEALL